MGMQVNTNIAANNAYRNLSTTQNDLSKSLEKLSSGLRINRAADDAAGLAISEGLKSQVGGLTVASRNAQDGISVIQTAEGSLNEVHSILQRVRDLAVQAGNDSNNAASRGAITTEVEALTEELGRISGSTNFNGTNLLDGSKAELSFQIGANKDETSQISVKMADIKQLASTLTTGSQGAVMTLDGSSTAGNLEFTSGNSTIVTGVSITAGDSAQVVAAALNKDADFTSGSLSASVDGDNNLVVRSTAGVDVSATAVTGFASGTATVGTLKFDSASDAATSIGLIDDAINAVSTSRAELGASQNRFESVIKNLAVSTENLTAAGSRIRDTDMAAEMVNYTRANILSQAGTAMLAQANQSNQGVLQLLR